MNDPPMIADQADGKSKGLVLFFDLRNLLYLRMESYAR